MGIQFVAGLLRSKVKAERLENPESQLETIVKTHIDSDETFLTITVTFFIVNLSKDIAEIRQLHDRGPFFLLVILCPNTLAKTSR